MLISLRFAARQSGVPRQLATLSRGSSPEPNRETATALLATLWRATWRYGISSSEWYEVTSRPRWRISTE